MAVCPEWRDTSALCAAARVRDRPAPRPARYESAGAAARARPVPCRGEAAITLRGQCGQDGGAEVDRGAGVAGVLRLRAAGVADTGPARHQRRAPARGGGEAGGLRGVVCGVPAIRQAGESHKSIGKYVSTIRAWYRRFYRAELGQGARGSRIADILKGYGRSVDQPPPMERIGCATADLARGMEIALASEPGIGAVRGIDIRYVGDGAGSGGCAGRWAA